MMYGVKEWLVILLIKDTCKGALRKGYVSVPNEENDGSKVLSQKFHVMELRALDVISHDNVHINLKG